MPWSTLSGSLTAKTVSSSGDIPSALATMVPIVDLSDNGFKVRTLPHIQDAEG